MSSFCSKNTCELDIVLTSTVNILTTNELVKLTMLWTTGPSTFWLKITLCKAMNLIKVLRSSSWHHSFFFFFVLRFYGPVNPMGSCRFLIVLGFNDTSTLEGHFVSSPREREKRDRRESRGDEREGQRRKRNRNESEETEELKTFPLYPYPLQG